MTEKELQQRRLVMKKILEDDEVFGGGIFQKEKLYQYKYGLSDEDIANMQLAISWALNGKEVKCTDKKVI